MASGKRTVARKVHLDGHVFDSAGEAERYSNLVLHQRAGLISDLEVHPKFTIQEEFVHPSMGKVQEVTWEADFRYRQVETGLVVIEDYKGYEYATFKLKLKFVLRYFHDSHVFINKDVRGWYTPRKISGTKKRVRR